MHRHPEIVPHTEVQGQFGGHFPVVLEERFEGSHSPVGLAVSAYRNSTCCQRSFAVLLNTTQIHVGESIARCNRTTREERHDTLRLSPERLVLLILLMEKPSLPGVLTRRISDILRPGVDWVRIEPWQRVSIFMSAEGRPPADIDRGKKRIGSVGGEQI